MAVRSLSEQQRAIIEWTRTGRGSANVVARAGCGKTFTLVEVVKDLVARGNRGIFFGAYNKDAADEIKVRLEKAQVRGVFASTMHAAGLRAWARSEPGVVVDNQKMPNILKGLWPDVHDKGKRAENPVLKVNRTFILRLVSMAKQHGAGFLWDLDDRLLWRELAERYDIELSLIESGKVGTPDGLEERIAEGVGYAIEALKESIDRDRNVLNFDDMIFAPLYHETQFYQHSWVLIDEAQDTNPARRALALAMLKPSGRLIAVGDPRQSVYRFTGADADAMDIIQQQLGSKVFPLNMTYRCPQAVVKVAQSWVPDIEAHSSAPDGDVMYGVRYSDFVNHPPDPSNDAVVLCRNNAPLVEIAYGWLRRGIPCMIEGKDLTGTLVQMMRKWNIKTIAGLETKLGEYYAREIKAATENEKGGRVAMLEDQRNTLRVLILGARDKKLTMIGQLVRMTEDMFGNIDTERPVLKLCSIHRSKGRGWMQVYIVGAERFQPSPYALKTEEVLQEENLMYVAATRAKDQLVYVDAKPLEDKFSGEVGETRRRIGDEAY